VRVFRILVLLVLALNGVPALAIDGTTLTLAQVDELYRAGNQAYQQQNYEEARAKYQQLADGGVRSPQVFYNLGNACARTNRKAEAVVYLSRARELDPHDGDIQANLARVAPASATTMLSMSHPMTWLSNRLSLSEWIGLFLAIYFAAGFAGAVYLALGRRPRFLKYTAYAAAALCATVALFGGYKYYQAYYVQYAVVAQAGTSIRSGPADSFAQVDTLGAGELVKNLGSSEAGWAQVQLTDGRKGYVPQGSILLI
jgi:tetratricopeptide (TPR) repeat protein